MKPGGEKGEIIVTERNYGTGNANKICRPGFHFSSYIKRASDLKPIEIKLLFLLGSKKIINQALLQGRAEVAEGLAVLVIIDEAVLDWVGYLNPAYPFIFDSTTKRNKREKNLPA